MNSINIIGTLTKDLEIKYLPSGSSIGSFSIAVNQDYKKDGQKVEKTSFFEVSTFGKQAEIIGQYFHKGSRIAISGELEQQNWKSQDGSNRSKVVIKLKEFSFVDKKSENKGEYNNQAQNNMQHYQQAMPYVQQAIQNIVVDKDEIPF